MNTKSEKTDIIILGRYTEDLKAFCSALTFLKVTHSILFFAGTTQLRSYLTKKYANTILIMPIVNKISQGCLEVIASLYSYPNLSIAVYDSSGILTNIEELFAIGVNVYIQKPLNRTDLIRTARKVMMMNAQFASGNLKRETYFLSA